VAGDEPGALLAGKDDDCEDGAAISVGDLVEVTIRVAAALPCGAEIRPVRDLFEYMLTGVRPDIACS
jgi:hypothetical protein